MLIGGLLVDVLYPQRTIQNSSTFFLLNFSIEEWGYEMSANATAFISYDAYSLSDISWVQFRSNYGNTLVNSLAYKSLSLSDKTKGSFNCNIE